MHPSLLVLLVGFLYILGFNALSYLRHQGLSGRFILEGLLLTGAGAALALAVPVQPLIFLLLLYLMTMRVRILIDLGNSVAGRGSPERALQFYDLALRLGADSWSRCVAQINRAAALIQIGKPEEAYQILHSIVTDPEVRLGAKYQAAACYNLGLACRRTGREAEAIQRFNEAIDALPGSVYAYGARQALKKDREQPAAETEREIRNT
ncbi:MAG: tetratricopeptide repeat protein [Thermoflexales bacterium]|nr:tetratricopeptide repeat protein [Thermoflexales bacterium]